MLVRFIAFVSQDRRLRAGFNRFDPTLGEGHWYSCAPGQSVAAVGWSNNPLNKYGFRLRPRMRPIECRGMIEKQRPGRQGYANAAVHKRPV
jgi:hypothetical protein